MQKTRPSDGSVLRKSKTDENCGVADRQERARVGRHEHPRALQHSSASMRLDQIRVVQSQMLEMAPQMSGEAAIPDQNDVGLLCHDHHRYRPLWFTV